VSYPAPFLLDAVYGKEESFNTAFYAQVVEDVLAEFGIKRENVVGISADNTGLMPSFSRSLGFVHIPCVAHVINLALRSICDVFKLEDLLGLRQFLAHSSQRQEALRALGINPTVFDTPATRWGYAIPALEVLTQEENWATLRKFVDENPPAKETANYASLVTNLKSPFVHACVVMAHALMRNAAPLIREAETGLAQMPREFFAHLQGYMDLLRAYHFGENTKNRVVQLTKQHSLKLKAEDLKKLENWTALAVEGAMDSFIKHLAESVVEHANGTATTRFLSLFNRHEHWRRIDSAFLPKPTDFDLLAEATGGDVCDDFIMQYGYFRSQLQAGRYAGIPGSEASFEELTAWWDAVRLSPATALVGRAALSSFLVPLSNSAVERSFSATANREIKNRLLAGERYARNTAMLACNPTIVRAVVSRRGAEIAYRLGKFVPEGVL
jgi:hypothetical protein